MKRTICLVAILLSGCTSIQRFTERHPAVAGIGFAMAVGAIAASASDKDERARLATPGDPCSPNPERCR